MVFANLLQEMYLKKLFLGRSHMGTLGPKRLKKNLSGTQGMCPTCHTLDTPLFKMLLFSTPLLPIYI
jgi:hypothetical protein